MSRSCTCSTLPPLVDLTDAFFASNQDEARAPRNKILLNNLALYGWSQVRIQPSPTILSSNKNSPSNSSSSSSSSSSKLFALQTPSDWKQRLVSLFDNSDIQNTPGVTYRQAESGKPGTIEPKESLEIQRTLTATNKQNDVVGELLDFTNLLHQVAIAVRRAVDLPPSVLLDEENNRDKRTSSPVDLLRVFYYNTVASTSPPVLGSSEHTDWGSFTVVWQDSVGGLQTCCHACQRWIDVLPTPLQADAWDFVVHVGDLTSICFGLALEEQSTSKSADPAMVLWPSPKHRVVSPTDRRRLSLVYFAYPPADASLETMRHGLKDWCRTSLSFTTNKKVRVPWEDFFLLQDQSSNGNLKKNDDPRAMYEKIASLSLKEVLQEKWNQVQR